MTLTPQQIEEMDKLTGLSAPATTSKTGAARFAELEKMSGNPIGQYGAGFLKGAIKGTIGTTQELGKDVLGLANKGVEKVTGVKLPETQGLELAQPQTPLEEKGATVGEVASYALPFSGEAVGAVKLGAKVGTALAKDGLEAVTNLGGGLGKKAVDFISADPEKKVATILKESKPEDVTNYASIAEKAASDPRVATPYEVVGNKLADVTKTLESKLSEIGKAKSAVIEPMREGLGSFSKETTPLIQKLTSLKNSFGEIEKGQRSVVQAIIDDAKTVATKLDADKFIDKVQDAVYRGNKDMTIAQGSALDKQLRGIIGEYNSSLKKALPKEYADLNQQYSELVDTVGVINKALGEVVEGVPTRGASLIKQFFSPSGTKAKEIFDFIKKETNGEVDLAKDATLAKFTMELFDDPRARSLLQGISDIPTTVTGAVGKVVEKLGGEKLQGAMRESTLKKAKEISLPK